MRGMERLKRRTDETSPRRAKRPPLHLGKRFEDEVLFFRTWATSPIKLGAFSPTGRALAQLMIKHANPDPRGYTLELGPGTGAVTEALLDAGIPAERVIAIEYDEGFYRRLRERFPKVNLIRGDALDLENTLGEFRDIRFSAALSGLPLLNIPKGRRAPYLEALLDRLVPGGVVSQLSYSLTPPQEAIPGRLAVDKSKWVTLNLPPGRTWIYRRP
jgi:phosphatidylethanolamine/phosphatidyl-N-methylethanolamine N-methyltransferase